ncbi:MAG: hypothetical protein ACP5IX_02875 [Patescibacteria group bacterium]
MSIKIKNNLIASFTLIELIISVGIIVVVIISAVGVYLYSIGPQQKTIATTNLQQDGQLIFNLIAKDIRANQIDYDYYGCLTDCSTPTDVLALTDAASPATFIQYRRCKYGENTDCTGAAGEICALKKCRGSTCGDCTTEGVWGEVTMADISVTKFDVYICPSCDPFISEATKYQIPQATIVLELKSRKEKFGEHRIRLQQTIPQRYQEKGRY